jgi:hypothetical protein
MVTRFPTELDANIPPVQNTVNFVAGAMEPLYTSKVHMFETGLNIITCDTIDDDGP